MQRLKDKTAMVVGAGSIGPGWGNGKATAVTFARQGVQVFCVDRNGEAARETVEIITAEGGKAAAFKMANALSIIGISNNLGDAKSLITHPATTTHQRLNAAARAEIGVTDGLVRLSAGLEHPDDLVEDILTALKAV